MSYGRAFALVMAAAVLSSTNGLFVRWMGDTGDWALVFWRHAALAVAMTLGLSLAYRGRLPAAVRNMGRAGLTGTLFFGAASVLYTVALRNAPVADVVFLLGAVPPLTALVAWLVLGERLLPSSWVAMAVALVGIGAMFAGGLGGGNLTGLLLATANAAVGVGFAVALRWGRAVDMLPMLALGSVVAAAVSAPFAFPGAALDLHQTGILLLWCGLVAPLYYTLFVISSRRLPGGELMLSLPVEIIAAVLLAWAVLGEVPRTASLAGGALVLAAVIGLALVRLRRPEA